MKTKHPGKSVDDRIMTACSVAPEDLRRGQYVAMVSEIFELPSFLWCDSFAVTPGEAVRVRFQSHCDGQPMKVCEICLPFVRVRLPRGRRQTLDVRRVQLVRLPARFAKAVWKTKKKKSRKK